jgi:hypothetical protein
MDWTGLTEVVLAAVRAAHRAGLPHVAGELYAVSPVQSDADFAVLADRVLTVKTLLRLRPPKPAQWRKCAAEFDNLYKEVALRAQR